MTGSADINTDQRSFLGMPVTHAFMLNGQVCVILPNGRGFVLGREEDAGNKPLEWTELPPVPWSTAWCLQQESEDATRWPKIRRTT